MEKERLKKANDLQKEIEEIDEFLRVVTKFDKEEKAIRSVNVIMKKEVEVKVSIIGSRFFGLGGHIQKILIPNSLRNDLIKLAEKRKNLLKKEFKQCFCTHKKMITVK